MRAALARSLGYVTASHTITSPGMAIVEKSVVVVACAPEVIAIR